MIYPFRFLNACLYITTAHPFLNGPIYSYRAGTINFPLLSNNPYFPPIIKFPASEVHGGRPPILTTAPLVVNDWISSYSIGTTTAPNVLIHPYLQSNSTIASPLKNH